MSLTVKLSLAERFLNWYPETKLYIRGQRGKDWAVQRALDRELFVQLCEFFDRTGVTKALGAQSRIDQALELWPDDDMIPHPLRARLIAIRASLTREGEDG